MSEEKVITGLLINSLLCGEGTLVAVEQVSSNRAKLTCGRCGVETTIALPDGCVDESGLDALSEGVMRLHSSKPAAGGGETPPS